jgi:hypothetical protein
MRASCARRPDLSFAFVPQLLVLIRLVWVQQGPPPRPPSPHPDTPSAPARPHRTKWEYSTRSFRSQTSFAVRRTRCCSPSMAATTSTAARSATGGRHAPLPHLPRYRAHPCRICDGTELTPYHICTGTGLIPATSAPGLGSPLPPLRRDWERASTTGLRHRRTCRCAFARLDGQCGPGVTADVADRPAEPLKPKA